MNFKMFNVNKLPHELLLTTRQKTKLINPFEKKISTDIKLSNAKIIQSGGVLFKGVAKTIKMKQKTKTRICKHVIRYFRS